MNMRGMSALLGIAWMLGGCANQPLVFSSGVVFGVNIAVNGSSTNPIDLTVGYKQLDATVLPVEAEASLKPIRACSNSAAGSEPNSACADSPAQPQSANAAAPAATKIQYRLPGMVKAFTVQSLEPGDYSDQANSSSDALSVYSNFSASAGASAGANAAANVGLGKVFATGIAAQNLSDGQKLSLIDTALSPAQCLQNLANVLNAGAKTAAATEAMVTVCKPAVPDNTGKPAPSPGKPAN